MRTARSFIHSAIKRFSGKVASCLDCTHFVRLWLRYWLQLANNPLFYDFLFTGVFSIFSLFFALSWQIDSTTLGKYWIQDEFSAFCRYLHYFFFLCSLRKKHSQLFKVDWSFGIRFFSHSFPPHHQLIRSGAIEFIKKLAKWWICLEKTIFFSFFITIPIYFKFPRLAEALSNCTIVNMISIIWNSDFLFIPA